MGAVASPSLAVLHEHAVRIAEAAGRLLVERQAGPRLVEYKDQLRRDPVTDADRAVETYLRQAIHERFPGQAILGEEGAASETGLAAGAEADLLWALDPLDGTANYAAGLPVYAVSIAVLQAGRPVVGCIAVPALGALYHGYRGGGAYEGNRRLTAHTGQTLQPGAPVGLAASWRLAFTARRRLGRRPGEPRALGSIAAELGLVAAGNLQYALYAAPKVWDVAAGVVLTEEAGGVAYSWPPGAGWRPLERFLASEAQSGLRGWAQPVLIGGAALVPAVAADLTPRASLLLGRLVQRLVKRQRGPATG